MGIFVQQKSECVLRASYRSQDENGDITKTVPDLRDGIRKGKGQTETYNFSRECKQGNGAG